MTPTTVVGIRLTPELIAKLDDDRGETARAEWVGRLIDQWAPPPPLPRASVRMASSDGICASSDEPPPNPPPLPPTVVLHRRSAVRKGPAKVPKGPHPKAEPCLHPVTRKIGDFCGVCGAAIAKGAR